MNTKTFLRDWKPGDVLTADGLQAITDAVAMLESCQPACGGTAGVPGGRRVLSDGPVEWPWQVYAVAGAEGVQLRYVPGKVLTGQVLQTDAETGEQLLLYSYTDACPEPAAEDPALAAYLVEDFDPATPEPSPVWLELTGQVEVEPLVEDAESYAVMRQRVTLTAAALRVTCQPAEDALRVWPLAVYTPGHGQPLTQLLCGDLSALEVRGVLDSQGAPLWPAERSTEAAPWGATGHAEGMATLCHADFSTAAETIVGDLYGALDSTGALELYLGPWPDGGDPDPAPDPEPWPDPEAEPEPDDDPPPGPIIPVRPSGDDEPPEEPTRVRYGYVAGEGFTSCQLELAADGELYWHLVLDPGYLASICAGLKVPATVAFEGNGTTPGANGYTVEMGLGSCTASATGMAAMGSATLLFHATNNVDVSKKRATVKVTYEGSPVWQQVQEWYLSPRKLHQPGSYVYRDKDSGYSDPWVEASQWYRWRVNKAAFRKAAAACFKQELGKVTMAASDSSTSYEAEVAATLTGTALKPTITFNLLPA